MPRGSRLPRFTDSDFVSPDAQRRKMNQLVTQIELRLTELEGPLVDPREPTAGQEVYAVTNALEQRAFDADTVTLAELADVVGTFLEDLRNEEKLR